MRKKFWTATEILKHNAVYNVVVGGRNLGKSYDIKNNQGLKRAWETKKPTFMIVRRENEDCKPSQIVSYFGDSPIELITGGEYNTVSAQSGIIYFSNADPVTGKVTRGIPCGYYVALNLAHHIKSEAFPTVETMIYEEFCANKYLGDEPNKLMHLVSTVFRSRIGRIWLIGNTVSRINPYFREWNLSKSFRQEINTIIDYHFPTVDEDGNPTTVKISVERAPSEGSQSGMFFGHSAKAINDGDYECNVHPHLERPQEDYSVLYEVLLMNSGFNFVLQLLCNDETGQLLLFAYPHTGKKQYDRVLSEEYDENPLHSVWFYKNFEIESIMLDLLNQKQIAFSDNLTGDECISTLKTLKASSL